MPARVVALCKYQGQSSCSHLCPNEYSSCTDAPQHWIDCHSSGSHPSNLFLFIHLPMRPLTKDRPNRTVEARSANITPPTTVRAAGTQTKPTSTQAKTHISHLTGISRPIIARTGRRRRLRPGSVPGYTSLAGRRRYSHTLLRCVWCDQSHTETNAR